MYYRFVLFQIVGDSFGGDLKTVAPSNTGWVMEPVGKGRIGSSLSSSLNDSFLSNFQPSLKPTGIDTEVGITVRQFELYISSCSIVFIYTLAILPFNPINWKDYTRAAVWKCLRHPTVYVKSVGI